MGRRGGRFSGFSCVNIAAEVRLAPTEVMGVIRERVQWADAPTQLIQQFDCLISRTDLIGMAGQRVPSPAAVETTAGWRLLF